MCQRKTICQLLSVESTWMSENVKCLAGPGRGYRSRRERESAVKTYSWFSYRYLAATQGTRNINGVPVKKWEPSKCKTVIWYTSVTAFYIYLLWLNFLSCKPLLYSTYLPGIHWLTVCRHTLPHTNTQSHTRPTGQLTPANAQIDFEVVPLCKHSDDQEVVEVDAFHQQPVAVGHDTVLHHHHGDATADRRLQDSSEVYFMNDKKINKNEAIWC